ncbi:MAG: TlpA family protein disulfide reductase [Roseivirga sp.]|nr:TlpA family protein disulfide reductase [Roseivirga sp.]
MKRVLFFSLGLYMALHSLNGYQKQPIEIKLTKRPGDQAFFDDFAPQVLVPVKDQYNSPRLSMNLIIPKKERQKENGVIEVRFMGGTHPSGQVLVLVADYKSDSPRFYIDQNQNGDFSDDESPLTFNNGVVNIDLKNHKNQSGIYRAMLKRFPAQTEQTRTRWKNNVSRKYGDTQLAEPDYWLARYHRNILSADVKKGDLTFQLGLRDTNLNGIYNDENDRLIVGDYGSDRMFTDFNNGAYRVGDRSPFAVGNKGFAIKSISADGTSIEIEPIGIDQVKSTLKTGEPLPELMIESLEGNPEKFSDLIEKDKYTFIDFWGIWCKGCVQELPQIEAISQEYSDKLKVIGLHCSTVSNERLKKFINAKKLSWTQKIAPDQVVEKMQVSGFPYGILLKPGGTIVAFNIRIEDVSKYLR